MSTDEVHGTRSELEFHRRATLPAPCLKLLAGRAERDDSGAVINPFVGPEWLRDHLSDVVVADVRWYLDGRVGRDAYRSGHVPGAVFVDVDSALAAPADPARGRHPLPDPADFARAMAAAGIGDDDTVIAYDDAGGVIAARLVWMLRATGHDAALLDGGIGAWTGALTTELPARPPALFAPVAWPSTRLASIDEVASGHAVVLDARDSARFRGDEEPVDPRAGHIPGARNLACRGHLGADGSLLDVAALRARFASVGVDDEGADVISYCGSGVTACHNLLVLEHAGLGVGRLFPGSWSQWSSDPARPVATGDAH